MKIGDKVRFLSEIGGGRVAGFQGKNVVLVEDEDGFQVPMQTSEVVVVGDESYDTSRLVEGKQQAAAQKKVQEPEPADRPVTFKAPVEERKGGEMLVVVVAWLIGIAIPLDFNIAFFFSIYIVLMETVSVIENLDLAGIPMPVWIIKRLKKTMQDMTDGTE